MNKDYKYGYDDIFGTMIDVTKYDNFKTEIDNYVDGVSQAFESSEEKLDKIPLVDIEQYLRKKKLKAIEG